MKRILTALFAMVCLAAMAHAQQTTAFSYQGKLNNASIPANGIYDFKFGLYRGLTDEFPLVTVANPAVQVTNGVFNVMLDFGPEAFIDGEDRYLEISVKAQSAPSFTTLTPRQQIGAVPYANRAQNAGFANIAQTANNAVNLGGTPAASFLQINGDGGQLTNVAGAVPWQQITGNITAARNRGYIVNSDTEVTITLPTAPQIGDIVRVAWGSGNGNYVVRTNAGQTITRPKSGSSSSWPAYGATSLWSSIAASSDGLKVAATGASPSSVPILQTSADGGITWVQQVFPGAGTPRQIDSSADGSTLAIIKSNGEILTSSDAGVNWTSRTSVGSGKAIAISSNGLTILAAATNGALFLSQDGGEEWLQLESAGARRWGTVAMNANGSRFIATELDATGTANSRVWLSLDSGATWNPVLPPDINWTVAAISSDGTRMAVASSSLYYSDDSGATWTKRANSASGWRALTMSANGLRMFAVQNEGTNNRLLTSEDSGQSWITEEGLRPWSAIDASADFSRLFAGTSDADRTFAFGRVYVKPSSLVYGGVRGDSAVELLYVGGGKFTVLSSSGAVSYF